METTKIKMALARMSRLIDDAVNLTDARKKQYKLLLNEAKDEVYRIDINPQVEVKLRLDDLEDFLKRGIK